MAGSGPTDLAALHQRLLRVPGLQFDFTTVKPPPTIQPPWWLKPLEAVFKWLGEVGKIAIAPGLPLFKVVFWVGLGLAVALLVWVIVREVLGARWSRRRRNRGARPPAPADWAPDVLRARALLENADRLAAQGRFDLAVRLILHRGVEDMDARRPRLVRPAQTARELAGLASVPAAARAAFTRIAAIVEFTAFAGRPIDRAAFDQCRAAYEAFVAPEAWR